MLCVLSNLLGCGKSSVSRTIKINSWGALCSLFKVIVGPNGYLFSPSDKDEEQRGALRLASEKGGRRRVILWGRGEWQRTWLTEMEWTSRRKVYRDTVLPEQLVLLYASLLKWSFRLLIHPVKHLHASFSSLVLRGARKHAFCYRVASFDEARCTKYMSLAYYLTA